MIDYVRGNNNTYLVEFIQNKRDKFNNSNENKDCMDRNNKIKKNVITCSEGVKIMMIIVYLNHKNIIKLYFIYLRLKTFF